jgi:hypothetical protein
MFPSPLENEKETCTVALLFVTIALIIAQMLDSSNTTDVVCREVNFSFKREQPAMIRAILIPSSRHAMPTPSGVGQSRGGVGMDGKLSI